MEVHIGKKHSDKFECGLCGFETKDIKYLNVHLRTCERYKYEHCEQKFATLSDVKIHLESFKLGLDLEIFHLKQNRSDSEVIDEKSHYVKDLFPELSKTRKWKMFNTCSIHQLNFKLNLQNFKTQATPA